MLAPVVLFVYKRPLHTVRTVTALARNPLAASTDLTIFSDGAKSPADARAVREVREYVDALASRRMFRSVRVVKADENCGLAGSVISGVSDVIEKSGRVIVLEDDHVSTPDFLRFMNQSLERYGPSKRVWSISGYSPPIDIPDDYNEEIYFAYRGSSWGYGTWQNRWNRVDWSVSDYTAFRRSRASIRRLDRGGRDMPLMLKNQMEGSIDSWAIRWCYTQAKLDMLTVYPIHSQIQNIGIDGSGTHSGFDFRYAVSLGCAPMEASLCEPFVDRRIIRSFRDFYGSRYEHVRGLMGMSAKKLLSIMHE